MISNRSTAVIIPIIEKVVRPDEAKCYLALQKNLDFVHQTVCHKYNFQDPITGVHTQHVESYNNKIKQQIK